MNETLLFFAAPVVLAILLVGIHAYLGLHVIEREVIFVDIGLSQVAALGGALCLLFVGEEETVWRIPGALLLCLAAAVVLSLFRKYEKKVSQEVIIGVTYALASGALILVMDRIPHGSEHLKSALIGNILFVTWSQVFVTALVYAVVGLVHFLFRKHFWENSRGTKPSFAWDFLFYFLFGIVITFSTHHAGVLVVFAILVTPAALAIRLVRGNARRLLTAWGLGVVGVLAAFYLSYVLDFPVGAGIVTTLAASFLLVLAFLNFARVDAKGP